MSILDVKEMTNDKCLMTKEGQNPNDEKLLSEPIRHSSIRIYFVIRHSCFVILFTSDRLAIVAFGTQWRLRRGRRNWHARRVRSPEEELRR